MDSLQKATTVEHLDREDPFQVGDFVWYRTDDEDDEDHVRPNGDLWCVMHIGSNFALLKRPYVTYNYTSSETVRVHVRDWEEIKFCPLADANEHIQAVCALEKSETRRIVGEIHDLCNRLGVSNKIAQQGVTGALVVARESAGDDYVKSLMKAKDADLPALYEQMKKSAARLSSSMEQLAMPLEAGIVAQEEIALRKVGSIAVRRRIPRNSSVFLLKISSQSVRCWYNRGVARMSNKANVSRSHSELKMEVAVTIFAVVMSVAILKESFVILSCAYCGSSNLTEGCSAVDYLD